MKYLNTTKIQSIISISQAILDASYYSEKNAEELLDNGIQFLTRLVVISHQALFNKPLHFAGMRLFILIIVDPDEQQFPLLVGERIEILPMQNLAERTVRGTVALQLDDHGGIGFPERNEHDVRESFSRRHFPDHRIAVQGIDESRIDGALQSILVVVAAVAGNMDVGDVQGRFFKPLRF